MLRDVRIVINVVINESPRGDSLCHNDVIMTWTNVDDCAARAMCLVITLIHMKFFTEFAATVDRFLTYVDPVIVVGDVNLHLERPSDP